MHHKGSFFRILPRILFSGGCLLLVSGLLLSVVITPALANGLFQGQSAARGDESASSVKQEAEAPGLWNLWWALCTPCQTITSTPEATETTKPDHTATPEETETGTKEPDLTVTPGETETEKPDRTSTPEETETKSPQPSDTPTQTLTPAPIIETEEPEPGPTETNTPRPPLDYNLSFVCAYPSDDFYTWKVANNTGKDVDYTWVVKNTGQDGEGSVKAGGSDYFFTAKDAERVTLYVDGDNVDEAVPSGPCKADPRISYECTGKGLDWYLTNPNDFEVEFTWQLENGTNDSGAVAANSRVLLTTTSAEEHTLTVTWVDNRPGEHTVKLTSGGMPCGEPPTLTPTQTETSQPPPPTETQTPTITLTPLLIEITETLTHTPTPTTTATPTPTTTLVPPNPPTLTFTPTATLVPQNPPTLTATVTLTSLPLVFFTPTGTATSTASLVQVAPALTVTQTPVLIPVTGADLTSSSLAGRLNTLGGLLINTGLFTLGLALALAAFSGQMKE